MAGRAGQGLYIPSTATAGHTTQISNFPCRITGGQIISGTSADGFAQFFDISSTGTVVLGSSTPSFVLGVLAGNLTAVAPGGAIAFENGLAIGMTSTTTGTAGLTLHISLILE